MMTTIPTAYLAKNLYTDLWGDPRNPHPVDEPVLVHPMPRDGERLIHYVTLASTLRQRLSLRHGSTHRFPEPACP